MGISLKNYNTFGLDVQAERLIELRDIEQLRSIDQLKEALIIGGGSNLLLTTDIEGTVVLNRLKGITETALDAQRILLEVDSGEVWHDLVLYAVDKGYGGIENLSLIPGSVGAAPMQNIGAYGVEVKDVIDYVEAVDLETLEVKRFSNEDCQFGYRESVFKRALKGQYFISRVGFILSRKDPTINSSYGAIKDTLEAAGIESPTIKDISNAVIAIRSAKLPDPAVLGNSGSFFKNPVITIEQFNRLKEQFSDIKYYPISDTLVKVPAGWLIESLGWKGKRVGNTGSHKDQALVLINYGGATGLEIKALSEAIKKSVKDTYNIILETEVNIL